MSSVADAVRDHVEWSKSVHRSRAWQNDRAALAKLVLHADELTPRSIRAALAVLEQDDRLSVRYRRDCWTRWLKFIRWSVEWEILEAHALVEISTFRPRFAPAAGRRQRRTPRLDEIPQLSTVDRDLVQLLLLTAARPGELLGLTNASISTHDSWGFAILDEHKTIEQIGSKPLVFSPRAMIILDRYRRPLCPGDWIFSAPKDPTRPLAVNTVSQRLRRKRITFTLYDCRRLAARQLRSDAGLDAAQAMLGHTRSSTTEIYAPVDYGNQIDAAAMLDEKLGEVLP